MVRQVRMDWCHCSLLSLIASALLTLQSGSPASAAKAARPRLTADVGDDGLPAQLGWKTGPKGGLLAHRQVFLPQEGSDRWAPNPCCRLPQLRQPWR